MASTADGRLEIEHEGRTLVVAARVVVVGRQHECALRVRHPLVSREHCRIELRPDGLFLCDLGSMNGTFLNGVQVAADTRLRRDDRIGLGRDGAILVVRAAEIGAQDLLDDESDLRTIPAGDAVPTTEVHVSVATQFVAGPADGTSVVLRVHGQEYPVDRAIATVGRGGECDLVLDEAVVSRRHCEIEVRTGGIFVRDLGSRHGTWIREKRIEVETALRPHDLVGLGRTGPRIQIASAHFDGRTVVRAD